jgi:hypothetical protein
MASVRRRCLPSGGWWRRAKGPLLRALGWLLARGTASEQHASRRRAIRCHHHYPWVHHFCPPVSSVSLACHLLCAAHI